MLGKSPSRRYPSVCKILLDLIQITRSTALIVMRFFHWGSFTQVMMGKNGQEWVMSIKVIPNCCSFCFLDNLFDLKARHHMSQMDFPLKIFQSARFYCILKGMDTPAGETTKSTLKDQPKIWIIRPKCFLLSVGRLSQAMSQGLVSQQRLWSDCTKVQADLRHWLTPTSVPVQFKLGHWHMSLTTRDLLIPR